MIELIFQYGIDYVFVRIKGNSVIFGAASFGIVQYTNISGLKLDYQGVIKEFPDLKDEDDWRQQAIARFKEKISSLGNEEAISEYIIQDLKKFGYKPRFKQRAGFRKEVIE